jgi:hypothetical protein
MKDGREYICEAASRNLGDNGSGWWILSSGGKGVDEVYPISRKAAKTCHPEVARLIEEHDNFCPPIDKLITDFQKKYPGATVYQGMKKKSVYIAGPMRGFPKYNFPAFDAAKKKLSPIFKTVISPADLDRDAGFVLPKGYKDWDKLPEGFDFEEAQKRDIAAVMKVDAVYMLRGWQWSKGARAEHALAEWRGIKRFYQEHGIV